MNKCLVTSIPEGVNVEGLETFVEGYKDYATNKVATQEINVVNSGLPVTSFNTGTDKIRLKFRAPNNDTQSPFLYGNNSSGGIRIYLIKQYASGSAGASTLELQGAYGSGSPDVLGTINKNTTYIMEFKRGNISVFDTSGNLVFSHTLSASGATDITKLWFSWNRLDVFDIEQLEILDANGHQKLNVYPMEYQGVGCLYDSVNNAYYYAEDDELTVGDYE